MHIRFSVEFEWINGKRFDFGVCDCRASCAEGERRGATVELRLSDLTKRLNLADFFGFVDGA